MLAMMLLVMLLLRRMGLLGRVCRSMANGVVVGIVGCVMTLLGRMGRAVAGCVQLLFGVRLLVLMLVGSLNI